MRYFSTQRPLTPGSFPKPQGNKVLNIVNFDSRQTVDEIGKRAWGYIEYEKPLLWGVAASYELVPVPTEARRLRYIGVDSHSRYVYEDETGQLWKLTDCCAPRSVCEERGDTPFTACRNEFNGEPDTPMSDSIKPVYISSAPAQGEHIWYEDLTRVQWDDLDNDGPTYDEVIMRGEKVFEQQKNGCVEQIWKYCDKWYTMVWDKKSRLNLSYKVRG